ncbi:MAG: phosphoribosylamine--glycine ligase [Candidatus Saccharibacteria bacterium]
MGRKVLVVGQGAREHAIVWKLSQSPEVEKIYAAPGNAGIAEIADCFDFAVDETVKLLDLVEQKGIDLTVVGPEVPLMNGLVDDFEKKGLRVFGPRANAARIEGSKVFTKELLRKYNIPTADFGVFTDVEAARAYIREKGAPIVVKADGLAAGKGVVVAADVEEAEAAVLAIMENRVFGEAGDQVVIEECLVGEEVSVFAICDGANAKFMASAQDHKRVFDNDQGPNTGGMGAYSSPPLYTPELHVQVMTQVINPVVKAMAAEGCPYKGILYAGIIVTADGPKVLEFNARFGDPEAQVVLPLLKSDLLNIIDAVIDGKLDEAPVEFKDEAAVCVVLASEGYPGSYPKGLEISGINDVADGTLVFHAGTKRQGAKLVTDGGRVLSVVCTGATVGQAIENVYKEVPKIDFAGVHYRKDIGARALK